MSQLLDMTTSWKENLLTKTCQITNSLFLFSGKIYLCLVTGVKKSDGWSNINMDCFNKLNLQ